MPITQHPLVDVQSHPDTRGVALQQVGVKNVELPITVLQKDGGTQSVHASISLSVNLPKEDKGTHLSRFMIQLADHIENKAFCYNLNSFLDETRKLLKANSAHITMDFRYFVKKPSPVTRLEAPMAYQCRFDASLDEKDQYRFALGVVVPVATLCPCSKAISDYGAHNQRAEIRVLAQLNTTEDHEVIWIEDMVAALDECSSCPVYPILKREDEKYVTERAYDNPKFVEDVIRECILYLRSVPMIEGFDVEVEAFESIHGHNAWAHQQEGL